LTNTFTVTAEVINIDISSKQIHVSNYRTIRLYA